MHKNENYYHEFLSRYFAVRIPDPGKETTKLMSFIYEELGVWDLSELGTGIFYDPEGNELWIKTTSAVFRGAPGDWIIRDYRLGYSICTDEAFRAMRNSEQGLWSLYEPKTDEQ